MQRGQLDIAITTKHIIEVKIYQKIRKYVNQALFFTGFWTSSTNGFGIFLSLEKKPLSLDPCG